MDISVIIPTYNRAQMLKKALESVLNQAYKAKEIIVVDDGSTDNTAEIFPIDGVLYKYIEHSGFPGRVRNIGVELSKYDYIAFLDSDDIWDKDKLSKQVEYFKNNPNCRILHTKEKWLMNNKVVSQKKRKHKRSGNIFKESLQGCIMGPSTILMEKSLFYEYGCFPEDIEVGEDYYLWLKICNCVEIDYLDMELISKIAGHGDQLSFKYGYIEPFKVDVLERLIKEECFTPDNRALAMEALILKYDIIKNGCTKRRNKSAADMYNNRKIKFLESI
ncbi:glycosyltransferase family 2 protein [Thiospirochaeta perfilievii]|uniref:Glycosyltransferase family 2 protein n=1 Tax=Thiospirochaeta perfilievii TaxID=252967 RepID=A0A5C1QAG6_9SPIO|nr:glycosyltransferase family A protein [Thiospirochaeta perfilievii]QEN05123.1 glycosyltransferase family 2 protein [Thiospirochaeta perfilievii]